MRCTCCSQSWEVQPSDCGCFGSSPIHPSAWYDLTVLDLYTSLAFAGTAATAFCEALEHASQQAGLNARHDDR
jgi:hypothetical protein